MGSKKSGKRVKSPSAENMVKTKRTKSGNLHNGPKTTDTSAEDLLINGSKVGEIGVEGVELNPMNGQRSGRMNNSKHYKGFLIKKIKGDGNCQFSALSDQLTGSPDQHEEYRTEVCLYMKEHQCDFEQSLTTSFDNYVNRMEKLKTWGDHRTLQAFCNLKNVIVYIHRRDGTLTTVRPSQELQPELRSLHLLYNGSHYDSLREVPDEDEGVVSLGTPLAVISDTTEIAPKRLFLKYGNSVIEFVVPPELQQIENVHFSVLYKDSAGMKKLNQSAVKERVKHPSDPQYGQVHELDDGSKYRFDGKRWFRMCYQPNCMRNAKKEGLCYRHFRKPQRRPQLVMNQIITDSNGRRRLFNGAHTYILCSEMDCNNGAITKFQGYCTLHANIKGIQKIDTAKIYLMSWSMINGTRAVVSTSCTTNPDIKSTCKRRLRYPECTDRHLSRKKDEWMPDIEGTWLLTSGPANLKIAMKMYTRNILPSICSVSKSTKKLPKKLENQINRAIIKSLNLLPEPTLYEMSKMKFWADVKEFQDYLTENPFTLSEDQIQIILKKVKDCVVAGQDMSGDYASDDDEDVDDDDDDRSESDDYGEES